ncbi:MAG: glycosyltransferase [Bdellovibrionales bacterium]|nr:glycosyltransferase [Bdellovibrionales bacterium]
MNELPIHFFTIVLNGNPFIQYHIDVFRSLPFRWHWHIVEGVAELKHDTGWSVENGGKIPEALHRDGLSVDGTSEYLDKLAEMYPDNITIYRKPAGRFWDGKREMVNAPLPSIQEEAILFQLDNDELWTKEQIETVHRLFSQHPEKSAAWFWCWFFVGPELVVSSRNCYAANPNYEWHRAWRFTPGSKWTTHEPPTLVDLSGQDIGRKNPFTHFETEEAGLLFQHFSYVTEEQLRFKEQYYGYTDALSKWKSLQTDHHFPILLRDYFSWVKDSTVVEPASRFHITPIATKGDGGWTWCGRRGEEQQERQPAKPASKIVEVNVSQVTPKIVIDGVYFTEEHRGIARVWRSLLEQWGASDFRDHVVLLDRNNTAPIIPGIRRRAIPAYNPQDLQNDRAMLDQVCREEQADVFCSTYYTTPEATPSLLLVHDMIPEVFGWDMNSHTDWQDKHRAIRQANQFVCVSENTKRDLFRFFPNLREGSATVIPNAYDQQLFRPASSEAILKFHMKYQIEKPYFLLVGPRLDYKNAQLLFDALSLFPAQHGYGVICTGRDRGAVEYGKLNTGSEIYSLQLSDEELAVAYTGAVALIFPSCYEGFGLPLIEAMACRCPVVAYPSGAVNEVGQDAVLYASDAAKMCSALCEVQKPEVRKQLIQAGIARANDFSWERSAKQWREVVETFASGQQSMKERQTQHLLAGLL